VTKPGVVSRLQVDAHAERGSTAYTTGPRPVGDAIRVNADSENLPAIALRFPRELGGRRTCMNEAAKSGSGFDYEGLRFWVEELTGILEKPIYAYDTPPPGIEIVPPIGPRNSSQVPGHPNQLASIRQSRTRGRREVERAKRILQQRRNSVG
jgi:hypothetical protein